MKRLNAKRIAAVVAGAALLGMGIAFAGPVTFQNVPIISNSGQPVVQIVIGSQAKPWDGVAAANIAAAIGNLAYTSVPVTVNVNSTEAAKVLHLSVTSPNYTLSNVQVWLNESGSTSIASGSYGFQALIGSVINRGVTNGVQYTKALQASGGNAYLESNSITLSPVASPYSAAGFVPLATSVSSNNNGGGVSFSGFSSGTAPSQYDNILQITSSQLPGLWSNGGAFGENENLWVTGFPVYDQATGVKNFALVDANGAYQVTFNKPIPVFTSNAKINNAQIRLLGTNWTIINFTLPGATAAASQTNAKTTSSSAVVNGGKLELAQSLSPITTIYVGQNVSSGPFSVQLVDLGQPNSNGISPAGLDIYYNGKLTNVSSILPPSLVKYNVSGSVLYLQVNQTFAGLYAYSKYAKVQLYANTWNITDGHVLNQTTNPDWYVNLFWTNGTSSGKANELQSIVIYGTSSEAQTLTPGQSISFITSPSAWKLEFVGETLGTSGFDPITATLNAAGNQQYANTGSAGGGTTITNVTEPAQELIVTSQIPNAFSFGGQTTATLTYDLTPYSLTESSNSHGLGGINAANAPVVGTYNTLLQLSAISLVNVITSANPLTVQVTGYVSNTATSPTGSSVTFTSNTQTLNAPIAFYNITGVQLQTAIAGTVSITANTFQVANAGIGAAGNSVTLATLSSTTDPVLLYAPAAGQVYDQIYQNPATSAPSVLYNQQNGQGTSTFSLTPNFAGANVVAGHITEFFTYSFGELAVPTDTAAVDSLGFGIFNSTSGVTSSPVFQLNYSESGTHNNVSYTSTTGAQVNAQQGFRTERGSKIASISPTSLTVNLAKTFDMLQFVAGPSTTSNSAVTTTYSLHGPYGIGQPTNIANVTVYKVTATPAFSGATTYNITGINNLTAAVTTSPAMADQPVLLMNLSSTTPIATLDSAANPQSNLILIGSGYVNSLSKQLEQSQNISVSASMGPNGQGYIVQAYGTNRIYVAGYSANQTQKAADVLIQDLYAAAANP